MAFIRSLLLHFAIGRDLMHHVFTVGFGVALVLTFSQQSFGEERFVVDERGPRGVDCAAMTMGKSHVGVGCRNGRVLIWELDRSEPVSDCLPDSGMMDICAIGILETKSEVTIGYISGAIACVNTNSGVSRDIARFAKKGTFAITVSSDENTIGAWKPGNVILQRGTASDIGLWSQARKRFTRDANAEGITFDQGGKETRRYVQTSDDGFWFLTMLKGGSVIGISGKRLLRVAVENGWNTEEIYVGDTELTSATLSEKQDEMLVTELRGKLIRVRPDGSACRVHLSTTQGEQFGGERNEVTTFALGPRGTLIAAHDSGRATTVQIWDLVSGTNVFEACIAGRSLPYIGVSDAYDVIAIGTSASEDGAADGPVLTVITMK